MFSKSFKTLEVLFDDFKKWVPDPPRLMNGKRGSMIGLQGCEVTTRVKYSRISSRDIFSSSIPNSGHRSAALNETLERKRRPLSAHARNNRWLKGVVAYWMTLVLRIGVGVRGMLLSSVVETRSILTGIIPLDEAMNKLQK